MGTGRVSPMVGVGMTDAVELSVWYKRRSQLTSMAQSVVTRQVKALVRRVGSVENARLVMELHLSSRVRRRTQKPVGFILRSLDEYVAYLGLDGSLDVQETGVAEGVVPDLPAHLVSVPARSAGIAVD